MIEIQDLQFGYGPGGFRLRVLRLTVGSGSRTAMIGPSGSGKTTLLNLIAGILPPTEGKLLTLGVDLAALHDAARRALRIRKIGLVFQEFELIEHLNVGDNILLPCRISPALKLTAEIRERAARLADEVGIRDKLRRSVRRLSQGERQGVAICRALLTEPPLLLCDEPTGNLDAANQEHVLDILDDYLDRSGATLLAVTHDREILPRFEAVIDFPQFRAAGEDRG